MEVAQPAGIGAGFDPSDLRLQNKVCKHDLSLLFWEGGLGSREESLGTRACSSDRHLCGILKDKQKRERARGGRGARLRGRAGAKVWGLISNQRNANENRMRHRLTKISGRCDAKCRRCAQTWELTPC